MEPAVAHLLARLRALEAPLAAAVAARQAVSDAVYPPGAPAHYVTVKQVQRVLATLRPSTNRSVTALDDPEERELRATGKVLPLDLLAAEHGLSRFETDVLVLCAAPELDRGYERVFGFIVDDLSRGAASLELCCALGDPPVDERLARRRLLGPHGHLRRAGLVETRGDVTELRQELRLAPVLLDALLGAPIELAGLFGDPAELRGTPGEAWPELRSAAAALAAGRLDVVSLHGGSPLERRAAALALAAASGRSLRRLEEPRASILRAAATNAILWVEAPAEDSASLEEQLAHTRVPLILSASTPWRPLALFVGRRVHELALPTPSLAAREEAWAATFPALPVGERRDLAARFRVGPIELRAAARLVDTREALAAPMAPVAAVRSVAHAGGGRFAQAVVPRRGVDDLILPPALHAQVLEVASFHRSWPGVADAWGFGRLVTGGGGVKALFTGDPGTGKTLAAEVIAASLGQTLLRVDLAHVVSKWVGETEKNLDEAFRQAERGQAVLFFDEAEALFGKRSEVRHGTDRYANLEVSYLLQRLEDHAGLVILASNLREQLDSAFIRRFQIVLHFPRPAESERRRLWRLAFPAGAPLAGDMSLDQLATYDLTGAAIVSAARTAGLLAAAAGRDEIGLPDVREGIARELSRDGRLPPSELLRSA